MGLFLAGFRRQGPIHGVPEKDGSMAAPKDQVLLTTILGNAAE